MQTIIDIKKAGPVPSVLRKYNRQILKTAMIATAFVWAEEMLPDHYDASAAGKYNYRPRDPEYTRRKERLYGHRDPHVFTGESRESAENYRVTGTSNQATVRIPGQRSNFSRRQDELKRITYSEARELSISFAGTHQHEVLKLQGKTET
jgi:hypothetical protein